MYIYIYKQEDPKKGKKKYAAPYWNRTSDLVMSDRKVFFFFTSDTLYHLANGAVAWKYNSA